MLGYIFNVLLAVGFHDSPIIIDSGIDRCGTQGVKMIFVGDGINESFENVTYHLTPIGEFAHLKVIQKINECVEGSKRGQCFIVSGGYEGLEFSWMVTGEDRVPSRRCPPGSQGVKFIDGIPYVIGAESSGFESGYGPQGPQGDNQNLRLWYDTIMNILPLGSEVDTLDFWVPNTRE